MIKPATISILQKELKNCSHDKLVEVCLRLSKYKLENKELISYLLFDADDELGYLKSVKEEMHEQMQSINLQSHYLAKKTLRKVIRITTKYIRFTASKQFEVEAWIYFLQLLYQHPQLIQQNKVIFNMKERSLQRIYKALSALHEDLQFDYQQELAQITP